MKGKKMVIHHVNEHITAIICFDYFVIVFDDGEHIIWIVFELLVHA